MDDLFLGRTMRQQKIKDFIEVLAATDDPNSAENQVDAARCVGLDWKSLTTDEIEYIEEAFANGDY